ncbi:hypothetical protein [Gilliamella sp. WF3-4]|uniref:hypothetical protein n=1 Tax=Gilliamella sp. WF3-4 TaxID=3120255 RepID=UPI00080DE68C|nr:hypothetical protein [Gilliamella apicola]OCG19644.1 hypothetical protein A9G47_00595 [Gilliamella apicola]
MGFKIPGYLRDKLSEQINKTEFDKAIFGQNWFSPALELDSSRIKKTQKKIAHEEDPRLAE